jgi:hypothetical protein
MVPNYYRPEVVYSYDRTAGLFEYPRGLRDEIADWLESIWDDLKSGTRRKSTSKKFRVTDRNLKGWKYYEQLARRYPDVLKSYLKNSSLPVTVKYNPKGGSSGSSGVMKGLYRLGLNIDQYTSLGQATKTLEHELSHWGQSFMEHILAKGLGHTRATPGIPPKTMPDEVEDSGNSYLDRHRKHKLLDREFYPLLRDNVTQVSDYLDDVIEEAEKYYEGVENEFNDPEPYAELAKELFPSLEPLFRYITKVDPKPSSRIPDEAANHFQTLGDDLFTITKRYNHEKWKKAVGLFYREVSKYQNPALWKKALGR